MDAFCQSCFRRQAEGVIDQKVCYCFYHVNNPIRGNNWYINAPKTKAMIIAAKTKYIALFHLTPLPRTAIVAMQGVYGEVTKLNTNICKGVRKTSKLKAAHIISIGNAMYTKSFSIILRNKH